MTTTNGQYPPKVCKRLDALHEQRSISKTHEKAALAKFKGEENGPRVDHRKSRGERIGKGATKTKGKKHARK